MIARTGLSGHIGNIWNMMCRSNCEDGILSDCTKSRSLQDLSQEVMEEMEGDHLHVLIRDAYLFGNNLVVINKAGKRIVVGFDDIPALRSIPIHDRDCFKIEENGSCLYWWTNDIHLDFESFLYCVDNEFRAKADKQKANHDRKFGKAIAIVRITYEIPIDGIAGLKAEDVQDIESGYLYPTSLPLTIISSTEYEELVSARETLGDRVRYLESKLSNADNALKAVERKLQDASLESNRHESALLSSREHNANHIEELQEKIERSQEANTTLEQNLDQALESVANLQKAIAEVKQQLSDSQAWAKELVKQNQNHINTIAKFVAQCDEVEKERNELIVEKGILRASFDNYQRSVAIAADMFLLEVQNLSPVEVKHE